MILDGLVKVSSEKIELTEMGHLLVRNVAMIFDKHLKEMGQSNKPMFSKTV